MEVIHLSPLPQVGWLGYRTAQKKNKQKTSLYGMNSLHIRLQIRENVTALYINN